MHRTLSCLSLLCALLATACNTPRSSTIRTPLEEARELYEDGDMEEAFDLAQGAADATSAVDAQHAALVAGLAAADLDRPDAESWLIRASTGPDRECAGTAYATHATLQERAGNIDAATRSMQRAVSFLQGPDRERATFELKRLLALRTAQPKPNRAERNKANEGSNGLGSKGGARMPGVNAKPVASGTEQGKAAANASAGASSATAKPRASSSKAASAVPSRTPHKWTLQAGAFESSEKAKTLALELEKDTNRLGLPVPEVVTVTIRGKTMHRVQVGVYDSAELAQAARVAWGRKGIVLGSAD